MIQDQQSALVWVFPMGMIAVMRHSQCQLCPPASDSAYPSQSRPESLLKQFPYLKCYEPTPPSYFYPVQFVQVPLLFPVIRLPLNSGSSIAYLLKRTGVLSASFEPTTKRRSRDWVVPAIAPPASLPDLPTILGVPDMET